MTREQAVVEEKAEISEYVPSFAEETFIVNCYGTEEDIARFDLLMEDPTDRANLVEMIILVEAIKNRNSLGMDWNCCFRCQRHSYCEINWYRGERGLKKTCCPNCLNYSDCNKIFISQRIGSCMATRRETPAPRPLAIVPPPTESPEKL